MDYKEIIEFLSVKRKACEITRKLGFTDRTWRQLVKDTNNLYGEHEVFIASDKNGYIATTDKNEIRRYAINRIVHGASEIKNGKKILKALGNSNQIKLEDGESDLLDLVMKMDI